MQRACERVGSVLKQKWRLDALLGVGGMAAVYAATHRNGKRVAIKMLHRELGAKDEVRQRFLREGYLANAVEHPGAVSVMDDDVSEDGSVFLVMELLEGETLEQRWERKGRTLPVAEVLSVASQLLDVLAAAHAKAIVHRDIKPENVFLTREAQIKVLDFGIAGLRELSVKGTDGNATQTGAMMGTPAFMLPEQARGRWDDVDARSDVWAVGATMFALLSGRYVHEAETVNEQLLSAMTTPAPSIATLVADLPAEVRETIDRALAFKKEDRWPDARAMQDAIGRAYGASLASLSIPAAASSAASVVDGGTSRPAGVTTSRGIVSAPSAAPLEEVPGSTEAPRRAALVVGAMASAVGMVLAAVGLTLHAPVAPATTTATAPVPTALDVALPAPSAGLSPRPADQVPIAIDLPAVAPSALPPARRVTLAPAPRPAAPLASAVPPAPAAPSSTRSSALDRRH